MKTIFPAVLIMLIEMSAFAEPSMGGLWKSECIPLPKRHSIISTLDISNSHLKSSTRLFADSACVTLNLTIIYDGSFRIGNKSGANFDFDFVPNVVSFQLQNLDVVRYYNTTASCGFTNWKLNEVRNVSGKFCSPVQMPSVGVLGYDIVNSNGISLQFGLFPQASPTNPANRPSKLSSAIQFFHQ